MLHHIYGKDLLQVLMENVLLAFATNLLIFFFTFTFREATGGISYNCGCREWSGWFFCGNFIFFV